MSLKSKKISTIIDWWGGGSSSPLLPEEIGTLFTENFTTLSNWDQVGGATFTPGGTGLLVSGGTGTTWTGEFIQQKGYVNGFENWTITCEFVITTLGGLAVGIDSVQKVIANPNGLNRSIFGRCAVSGGNYFAAVTGFAEGNGGPGATNFSISAGSPASVNDSMRVVFSRTSFGLYDINVTNITKGTTQTTQYVWSSAQMAVPNVIGKFSLHASNGAQRVTSYSVSTTAKKNIRAVFVGDSITQMLSATLFTNRYANKTFNGSLYEFAVQAGGNLRIEHMIQAINMILLQNPDYAFVSAGNNVIDGNAIDNANYISFRNQVVTAGKSIVHLIPGPRNAIDFRPYRDWILGYSPFTNDIKINLFDLLKGAGAYDLAAAYDSGDGVHWNNAGHLVVANYINTQLPSLT